MKKKVQSILPDIPKRIRLIAFDLDGTLADTFEDIARATNSVLRAFDCPTLDTATIKSYVGRGARYLVARALGPDKETFADAATVLWREHYERHPTDHTTLYPGTVALLEWLRERNVRTAIVSNKLDGLTKQIAGTMGLADRVDFVRGESDEFPRKPDPALLDHVLELYGVKREESVMVGDSAPDFELAQSAGVTFCGVLTGLATRDEWRSLGATWTVETLAVLHEQLRASGACEP